MTEQTRKPNDAREIRPGKLYTAEQQLAELTKKFTDEWS